MIVGTPPCRAQPLGVMQGLGYQCAEVEDVYAAMSELCRRPLVYRSLVLSLGSLFREELQLIAAVKKRFPHVVIYLSGIEGRQAAFTEAMQLGADGLLADDGLHPIEATGDDAVVAPPSHPPPTEVQDDVVPRPPESPETEPVLTAEELQALLEEHEPSTQRD